MQVSRHARWSILAALLMSFASGCSLIHPRVSVLIRDAETKAPIPDAEVTVRTINDEDPDIQRPFVTTNAEGIAKIAASQRGTSILLLGVNAQGYLPGELSLNDAARNASTPGVYGVVDVFAGPRPTVMLVLPTGFRGIVKTELMTDAQAPTKPGQREFEVKVNENGIAELNGPPILRHWPGPEFRARFADGGIVQASGKDEDISLHWIRGNGTEFIHLVGTKADLIKVRGSIPAQAQPRSNPGTLQRGGRGGHRGGRGANRDGGNSGQGNASGGN